MDRVWKSRTEANNQGAEIGGFACAMYKLEVFVNQEILRERQRI
jgi:hypothetical protein